MPRQLALLRFIAGYMECHKGVAPTYREMREALGLSGKSSTFGLITGLEARGLIRRMPSRARAIELLVPVTIPRAPDGAPLWMVPLKGIAA